MSRFLFTTLPSNDLGLLTRSLPIAKGLSERGHEVCFSSPARAPSTLIAEAGFENLTPKHPFYELQLDELSIKYIWSLLTSKELREKYGSISSFLFQLVWALPIRRAPQTNEVWNMDHAAAMAGMMNKNFVRANCYALRDLILVKDPDVIVDFWNPMACIAAKALNKPLITVIQADGHPSGNGFIWWKEPPPDLPSALPTINAVLSGYGLKPITKTEELSIGDLTLIVGSPETDPLPDGARCTYIGPMLWQNPNAKLPDHIEAINNTKPLIWAYSGNPRYASNSTAFDSEIIIDTCVEVLANEDVQVVLTTGHHALPEKFLPLPNNFMFEKFVPGLAMAEKCDMMIHHGGYGSCQTGLYTGTPSVIIPTFSERESNARRIASLTAGEYVLPNTDGIAKYVDLNRFRSTVMNVLSDLRYRTNAKRYSVKLRAYGGVESVVQIIEQFMKTI